jgi:hypothetical protein
MTLAKLREGQVKRISTNPATVRWIVADMIDDGYGGMIENPHASHTNDVYYVDDVMIANMSSAISDKKGESASFGYSQPLLITAKWDALWMTNGMVIQYNERKYRVEDMQSVRYMGEVISKIAKLTDVTPVTDDVVLIGGTQWTPTDDDVVVIGGV